MSSMFLGVDSNLTETIEGLKSIIVALENRLKTADAIMESMHKNKPTIAFDEAVKSLQKEKEDLKKDVLKICEEVRMTGIPSMISPETTRMHIELSAQMEIVRKLEELLKK